ncbi:transcriptional regulator [bacterium]|nr:MAG: transcriptional regulator [bacterium]
MGDVTRQSIIVLLARYEHLSVKELTTYTSLSRPAISHHIKILRDAGLIDERRDGVRRYYSPNFTRYIGPMKQIIEKIEQWEKLSMHTKQGDDNGK